MTEEGIDRQKDRERDMLKGIQCFQRRFMHHAACLQANVLFPEVSLTNTLGIKSSKPLAAFLHTTGQRKVNRQLHRGRQRTRAFNISREAVCISPIRLYCSL